MTFPSLNRITPDSIRAALSMYQGEVPCFMSLADPPCPHPAAFVIYFEHEENAADDCRCDPPVPACPDHTVVFRQASHPFWRTWMNMEPSRCGLCGIATRVSKIERI